MQLVVLVTASLVFTNLDSFAVVFHVDLTVPGDLACLDHRLEMRQVIHVPAHVRRQHLHRSNIALSISETSLYQH